MRIKRLRKKKFALSVHLVYTHLNNKANLSILQLKLEATSTNWRRDKAENEKTCIADLKI